MSPGTERREAGTSKESILPSLTACLHYCPKESQLQGGMRRGACPHIWEGRKHATTVTTQCGKCYEMCSWYPGGTPGTPAPASQTHCNSAWVRRWEGSRLYRGDVWVESSRTGGTSLVTQWARGGGTARAKVGEKYGYRKQGSPLWLVCRRAGPREEARK